MKISGLTEITQPEAADILAGVDSSAQTTEYIKIGTLLAMIYPVGSLYINATDSTSPATLFGFGTWTRIKGKMVVGVDENDPDFAQGATGGQKVVQSHSHGVNDPGHAHNVYDPGHRHNSVDGSQVVIQSSSTLRTATSGSGAQITYGNAVTTNNGSNIGIYGNGTGISIQSAGQGNNNMNPYAAAFIWQRTA